jgi:hypothetical protein
LVMKLLNLRRHPDSRQQQRKLSNPNPRLEQYGQYGRCAVAKLRRANPWAQDGILCRRQQCQSPATVLGCQSLPPLS